MASSRSSWSSGGKMPHGAATAASAAMSWVRRPSLPLCPASATNVSLALGHALASAQAVSGGLEMSWRPWKSLRCVEQVQHAGLAPDRSVVVFYDEGVFVITRLRRIRAQVPEIGNALDPVLGNERGDLAVVVDAEVAPGLRQPALDQ